MKDGFDRAAIILGTGLFLAALLFFLVLQRAPTDTTPNSHLRTSWVGYQLIKDREDLRLTAYKGPSGKWTVGWGHTETAVPGMTISKAQASKLLKQDVEKAERDVRRLVEVPLNRNEFDALVSFTFNVGVTRFRRSSVLKELNAGNREAAADAFLLWTKIRINGELQDSSYLKRYRELEKELFLKPV